MKIPRTDVNGEPIRERDGDRNAAAKLEYFLERNWRTIVTVIWLISGWYAANVYQPIRAIPQLIVRDSVRAAETQNLELRQDKMEGVIMTLSRISCFTLDDIDRVKYDIDCSRIPLPLKGGTANR